MARRERGGSKILLVVVVVGLFLVASCHCIRLTKLKALDAPRGDSTLSHGQAKGGETSHGRLLIGSDSLQGAKLKGRKTTETLQDYQADMGWVKLKQPKGDDNDDDEVSELKQDDVAVERLLKMQPKVECTGDSMKLKVEDAASTPGSLLFVDRGQELSPLPLSKLPSSCGYTIRSTRKDLVLVAPYDGCFVSLQEDSYVLPLRWCGLPVKMSCPLMGQASSNPPMVTCHAEGMVVKTEWTVPVAKIKVNLNGNWEPLMKASPRCGFGLVEHPEGVVISVSYASCMEMKDGMYSLELSGDGEVKISCPPMSTAQAEPTKGQAKAPKEQTETPGKGVYPANPAPTSAPEPPSKKPAQPAVPQVPGFPENPKLPIKKPIKGIDQPQFPHFPFPPDSYPANPDPRPTPAVQPTPPPVPKKNGQQPRHPVPPARLPLNPGGQVPNPFLPQGPYQIPVLPTQPTPTQAPKGKNEQPLSPMQPEVSKPKTPEYLSPSKPPAPESKEPADPQGQVPQQFNPYFFYYPKPDDQSPPAEKPTAAPAPPATEKPAAVPQPEAPQGQIPQQFNPYFFYYPKPDDQSPPAEKPTAAPAPPATEKPAAVPQPEAPQGQIPQQFNPYFFYYPKPDDQSPPAEKPTAAPAPPATEKPAAVPQPEAPQGQVPQQFNPYFYLYPKPDDEGPPAEKPTAAPAPPATEKLTVVPQSSEPVAPQGQVPQQFNPYFFYYPKPDDQSPPAEKPNAAPAGPGKVPYPFNPDYFPQQPSQPVTLPPATSMQQPPEATTVASSQAPQSGSSNMSPMNCLQYCSPGYTNCCPQIAFHQHLHHIVPAGTGSEKLPSIYPGVPFLPSAYSGFHNGFVPPAPPLKPTEAATTSTSAPISTQSSPSGNEKQTQNQPPGGNPAVLLGNNPSKPSHPQQIYPYFVPNSGYPYQPYQPQNELQNFPQRQSPAHYTVPSKPQAPGYDPANQMPSNLQPPTQQNNQPSAGDMNEPPGPNFWSLVAQRLKQQIAEKESRSEGLHNSTQPEPFVSASKKSPRYEQNANPYFEPKNYVLLQHGPPGREGEFPLPFRNLLHHDPNFLAQNLARHQGSKSPHPQTLMPSQEKTQHPKRQGKVMPNPLPGNVNHVPIEKSERPPLLYSASNAPHLVPLPQDPSRFQQWSSAANHQTHGLNQPIQREGGNLKQK